MVINGGFLRKLPFLDLGEIWDIDFTWEPQGREKHTGLLMIL